jgi:hypothetical protein
MFKPIRVVATIILFASIGLVFVGAFVLGSELLCISMCHPTILMLLLISFTVFVIIEYLAYTWYTLSYIPYARSAVLKVFGMS